MSLISKSARVLANHKAKKVGLGFDLPPSLLGLHGLQSVTNVHSKEAA
jgi:hypothetical protein